MVLQNSQICERAVKEINEDPEMRELHDHFSVIKTTNTQFKAFSMNGDGARLTRSDDGGYTSSCSSSSQPMEEAAYIVEQTICLQTTNGSDLSSDSDFAKKQAQAFQESFNSFLELTADDKTDDSCDQVPMNNGNGHFDVEVDELIQLQRQLVNNSNQLSRMNERLKSTAGICEREIKEIKTFLLCLDRRNTDLIKKTTKTKNELYDRMKNIEGEVRFIKMDQKEVPALTEQINSIEKRQITLDDDMAELKEQVRKNNKELSSILSRCSSDDTVTSPFNLNKQMDDMERRLTKGFFAFFIMLVFVTFAMTFWMNKERLFADCLSNKESL